MLIERSSQITGKLSSMELDVTVDQLERWENGELVQNVMPHLTPEEREFILTGITADEWDDTFAGEE